MTDAKYRIKVVDDLADIEAVINRLSEEGFELHSLVPLPANTSGHNWIAVGVRPRGYVVRQG